MKKTSMSFKVKGVTEGAGLKGASKPSGKPAMAKSSIKGCSK